MVQFRTLYMKERMDVLLDSIWPQSNVNFLARNLDTPIVVKGGTLLVLVDKAELCDCYKNILRWTLYPKKIIYIYTHNYEY